MAHEPTLIIQLPRGGAVDRQLTEQQPQSVASGEVVIERQREPSTSGEVVMSVPSPEALAREADEVRSVIQQAGTGAEPLVLEVEGAEELREDELAAVLEAAGHSSRAVMLRIVRDV
jgi:hypothetical protein